MKKLLTVAIAVMTVATLVSCGAQPQDRQGFSKAADKATETMTTLNGTEASDNYIYDTGAITTNADLAKININLAGLLGDQFATTPITYFGMAVVINSANTEALLVISFETEDNVYEIKPIPSVGTITHKNGQMLINFSDEYGTLMLTGTPASATAVKVNIKDPRSSIYFAQGTPLTLKQVPKAAGTTR